MTPGTSTQLDETLAFVAGDTWGGLSASSITPIPADSLTLIEFIVRDSPTTLNNRLKLDSDTDIPENPGTKQIVISSAANWTFYIPRQILNLPPNTYYWQMKFTRDGETLPVTYLAGNLVVSAFKDQ